MLYLSCPWFWLRRVLLHSHVDKLNSLRQEVIDVRDTSSDAYRANRKLNNIELKASAILDLKDAFTPNQLVRNAPDQNPESKGFIEQVNDLEADLYALERRLSQSDSTPTWTEFTDQTAAEARSFSDRNSSYPDDLESGEASTGFTYSQLQTLKDQLAALAN